MRYTAIACLMLCGLLPVAHAQVPTPSADQMVQQLKAAPRTRSLRNLNVEAAAAEAAPRPSLSLLIQFDFNSARVSPQSKKALATLSQALQSPELLHSQFAVEGHTDAKGGDAYNLQLSAQRAQAVVGVLKAHGVAQERLTANGKGSTELANPGDPLAAENRRVRIVNLD
jgi:outer membrane protein OmpA-like peptidoglycan-associated protein